MYTNRRRVIKSLGAAGVFGLAGCAGNDGSSNGDGGGNDNGDTDGGTTTTNKAEKITLKWAHALPAGDHYITKNWINYHAERVEELTNGQVTFKLYPSEEIGGATQYLDMVKNDAIQIGYAVGGYYPGRFHLSSVTGLPQSHTSSQHGTEALWDITDPGDDSILFTEEFKDYGLYPLHMLAHVPYQLMTKGKGNKFTNFSNIEGLPVRSTGGTQSLTLDAMGVDPVELEGVELYQAMERGTVKGYTFPLSSISAYDLQKVTDYITLNGNMTSSTLMNFMSLDKWNSFPDNVKEAMRKAGDEAMGRASKAVDDKVGTEIDAFKQMDGVEVYNIPDDTVSELNERLSPVKEKWAKQQKDRDLPGTKVLDAWDKALENAANTDGTEF